jgi:hypothetical protein
MKLRDAERLWINQIIYITLIALALLMLCAATARSQDNIARLGLITTTTLDFTSSLSFNQDTKFVEQNPLLVQNPAIRAGLMGASTTACILLTRKSVIRQRWLRLSILLGVSAGHGLAALHNYRSK